MEENSRQDKEWQAQVADTASNRVDPAAGAYSTAGSHAIGSGPAAGVTPAALAFSDSARGERSAAPMPTIGDGTSHTEGDGPAVPKELDNHFCSGGGADQADLNVRVSMAALDLFSDDNGEGEIDEDYDSEDDDTLVDSEGPEQDLHDEDAENVTDQASKEYHERMKGMAAPPHPEGEDPLGNPFVVIVDTNGLHYLPIHYCICPSARPRDEQLLQARLFPSSFTSIKTVFTFRVLDDFRMTNLCCKSSCYQYFLKLRRITCPAFPKSVPVSSQWKPKLNTNLTLLSGSMAEPIPGINASQPSMEKLGAAKVLWIWS